LALKKERRAAMRRVFASDSIIWSSENATFNPQTLKIRADSRQCAVVSMLFRIYDAQVAAILEPNFWMVPHEGRGY
jgi:hypothetical protein